MNLKTLAFSVMLAASSSSFANGTNPGVVTITVDGAKYRVYAESLSSVPDQNFLTKLESTAWYGSPPFDFRDAVANAYYAASNGYEPTKMAVLEVIGVYNYGPFVVDLISIGNDGSFVRFATSAIGDYGDLFGFFDEFSNLLNDAAGKNSAVWFLLQAPDPTAGETIDSFRPNAFALRNAFNLQSAKIAQGLSYDCTVYDQKNICVSFAGSKSGGKGFDATTGALIIAHKPTTNFRFGGYIDQSFGSSTSGGLTTKKGNPGFGAFAVWSQKADGSGVQVRAAANVGKVDIETTRIVGYESWAEEGFGQSSIKSQGFSLEVSNDYAINSMWSARPYVGYRKTTNKRAGYTESGDFVAPLSYATLKQNTETLTAGATFAHALSEKTKLFLTAGVEHDLKNRIGNYQAASEIIGDIASIDMGSNKTKTRPTVSFALNHDIDKTQRVGLSLTHRKEAFASGSTTSAFLQYSKGF
jgi:hypothetical protein